MIMNRIPSPAALPKAACLAAMLAGTVMAATGASLGDTGYLLRGSRVDAGQQALEQGRYADAAHHYRAALRHGLRGTRARAVRINLCAAERAAGAYEKAVTACTEALAADADAWQALVHRGLALKQLGRPAGARGDLQAALTRLEDGIAPGPEKTAAALAETLAAALNSLPPVVTAAR